MTLNLSEQEIQQVLLFLSRAQLNGSEAMTLAVLQQKITQQVQMAQQTPKTVDNITKEVKEEKKDK